MPCLHITVSRSLTANLVAAITRVCSTSSTHNPDYYPLICTDGYLIIGINDSKSYLYVKRKNE